MEEVKKGLLVKFGEIFLRGENKIYFERLLVENILKSIGRSNYFVKKEQGRFLVTAINGEMDYERVIPDILKVFGITAVCPCVVVKEVEIEKLKGLAVKHINEVLDESDKEVRTFKVDTSRADKSYPMSSYEVSCAVGEAVFEACELTVDLHNPDLLLRVEIRNNTYIYSKVIKGEGGLPVSSTGKALLLLSGGIDSPVAGFLTAKRGAQVEAVYFHSPPHTSERALQKVTDLSAALAGYTCGLKLHVVNFTEIQLFLNDRVPLKKLTIFLKRAMLKAACVLAENTGAQVIVTGDAIGQVASQTLASLAAIDSASSLPVIRPLAGFDKQEIINISKRIGTFDISIRPYDDCCTLFLADNPETKPKKSVIEIMESKITELDSLIEKAVQCSQMLEY